MGYAAIKSLPNWVGFGMAGKTEFWLARRDPINTGVHVAWRCDRRKQVDDFYAAALKAGGRDNGKPGLREDYQPNSQAHPGRARS